MAGHSYADDTQVCSHFSWNMCNANVLSMVACIGDINRWMTSNWLKLNTDKTDFILLGTRQQLGKTSLKEIDINGVRVPVSTTVTCLGVLIDSELMFAAHIRRLTCRCFY